MFRQGWQSYTTADWSIEGTELKCGEANAAQHAKGHDWLVLSVKGRWELAGRPEIANSNLVKYF